MLRLFMFLNSEIALQQNPEPRNTLQMPINEPYLAPKRCIIGTL